VPPAHRHNERPRTTNRRSTWAGVSWPNEDANEASELDVFCEQIAVWDSADRGARRDAIRAFVGVLARQAARELFDSQLRRGTEVVH